jgi:hypothetical protein
VEGLFKKCLETARDFDLNVSIIARGCLEMELGVFCNCRGTSLGNKIKDCERYGQNNTI